MYPRHFVHCALWKTIPILQNTEAVHSRYVPIGGTDACIDVQNCKASTKLPLTIIATIDFISNWLSACVWWNHHLVHLGGIANFTAGGCVNDDVTVANRLVLICEVIHVFYRL